jgi:hypothetical protein
MRAGISPGAASSFRAPAPNGAALGMVIAK